MRSCQYRFLPIFIGLLLTLTSCISEVAPSHSNENVELMYDFEWPGAHILTWSPTGASLAITSIDRNANKSRILVLDIETGRLETVFETAGGGVITAYDWSPNEQEILVSVDGGGDYEPGIWLLHLASGELKEYLGVGREPSWSLAGAILFRQGNLLEGTDSLVIASHDSGNFAMNEIYSTSRQIVTPDIAPAGQRVVFSSHARGLDAYGDIYLYDIETDMIERLTHGGGNIQPAWSPNGELIAFINYGGQDEFFSLIIAAKSGECSMSIEGLMNPWSPTWSPDSRRIAFVSNYDVFVLNLESYLSQEADGLQSSCFRFD